MLKLLLTIFLYQWLALNAQNCPRNTVCTTRGGYPGRCAPYKDCAFGWSQALSGLSTFSWLSIYSRSILGESRLTVCCKLQSEPNCGSMMIQDHIYGGVETYPDEFPWTAIIIEFKPSSGEPFFKCGGTLINRRFVVTAAHCVYESRESREYMIGLGAWNLSNYEENSTVYIYPEKIFVHDMYSRNSNNKEHDIAIIKLEHDAPRTDFIEPICLPTQPDYKLELEMPFFVTGWGATEKGNLSQSKMKLKLPVKTISACEKAYANTNFTENHLCVGGSPGKDSCSGDSGGPLMTAINHRAYLVGIVSWGPKICGQKDVPSVYTRFDKYLEWVEAKMEEAS